MAPPAGGSTLVFAATVANANGSPDVNLANDMSAVARTSVKAAGVCNNAPNPTALQLGPTAQTAIIHLGIGDGCAWTANSAASWLTVSPASGTGEATLVLTLAANSSVLLRSGSVDVNVGVNAHPVLITQIGLYDGPANPAPPGACAALSLPRAGDIFAANETTGSQSFQVVAGKPCAWSARPDVQWITVVAASGSGNGIVGFRLERNPGPQFRRGTITVAGQIFTVNQEGTGAAPGGNASDAGGDSGQSQDGDHRSVPGGSDFVPT